MKEKQADNSNHHSKWLSSFSSKLQSTNSFQMYIGRILIVSTVFFLTVQQIAIMACFICPLYIGFIVLVCLLDISVIYTFHQLIKISQQELLTYDTKQNEIIEKAIGKIFKLQSPHHESIDISNKTLSQESKDLQMFCQHCSKNQQKYLFHCRLLNICLNIKKKKKYFLFFVFLFMFKIFTIIVNFIVIFQEKQKNIYEQIIIVLSLMECFLQVFLLGNYLSNKNFKMQKKSIQKSENFFQKKDNFINNQIFPMPIFTKENQNSQFQIEDSIKFRQKQKTTQVKFNLNIRKRTKRMKQQKSQKQDSENDNKSSCFKQRISLSKSINQSQKQNQKHQQKQPKIIQKDQNLLKNMLTLKPRSKLNPLKQTIDQTKDSYMRRFIFQNSQVQTPKMPCV